jgi:hypothetical protein
MSEFNEEDAESIIIDMLRSMGPHVGSYGYEVYLPNVVALHLAGDPAQMRKYYGSIELRSLSPLFYAAAWNLCRRGILRPGVKLMGEQATDDGGGGNGYSVTPFGRKWLSESQAESYMPTEPGRFARLFEPYRELFGIGFFERAQEANKCYNAQAYLGCCAMCGAAAESIFLSMAIAKRKDEEEVVKIYRKANGRAEIESIVGSGVRDGLRKRLHAHVELLKYWRDEAAHGRVSRICDDEAYIALAMLLKFAKFAYDNRDNFLAAQ